MSPENVVVVAVEDCNRCRQHQYAVRSICKEFWPCINDDKRQSLQACSVLFRGRFKDMHLECRNSNAIKSSRRPLGEGGCERGTRLSPLHCSGPNLATATSRPSAGRPPSSHSSLLHQGSLSTNPASPAEASAFHFRSAGRREVHCHCTHCTAHEISYPTSWMVT